MSAWTDPELLKLFLNDTPLIDVRAPIEFDAGSVPHSYNFPIMNNEERHLVGTCYIEKGQAEAIKLGHSLVSGAIKEQRIEAWKNFIQTHPTAQVFCFRGGLRSQISCEWLKSAGIERTPIKGGYKRIRNFFLSYLDEAPLLPLYRIGGLTGSGKTELLKALPHTVDLEHRASHRGSAFGLVGSQPSQVRFENELALDLMKQKDFVILEDESPMIGKVTIPRRFFAHMKDSPLIILKTSMEERTVNIFKEYVLPSTFEALHVSLSKVARRLGGVRFKEVEENLKKAFQHEKKVEHHVDWIQGLLNYYYDPVYTEGLRRNPGKVIFEGNAEEIREFIKSSPPKQGALRKIIQAT